MHVAAFPTQTFQRRTGMTDAISDASHPVVFKYENLGRLVEGSKQRQDAKPFSFGIGYGMRAKGVAMRTGGTKEQAQIQVDRYFAGAPELLPHIQSIEDQAVRMGFVTTQFGRVVWIPEIHSPF